MPITNTETMRLVALAASDRGAPVPEGAYGKPGTFIIAPLDNDRHVIAIGRSVEVVPTADVMDIVHALCDSVRSSEVRWPMRTPPGRVPE